MTSPQTTRTTTTSEPVCAAPACGACMAGWRRRGPALTWCGVSAGAEGAPHTAVCKGVSHGGPAPTWWACTYMVCTGAEGAPRTSVCKGVSHGGGVRVCRRCDPTRVSRPTWPVCGAAL